MPNKTLVMGATGKVGYEVVKCLVKQRENVIAAIHHPKNASIFADFGVNVVLLDISQSESIKIALNEVKNLFLLIPSANLDTESAMADQIINYAKQMRVENIVHLSGMNAEKFESYGAIHAEKYLDETNIMHVHLRPNFFMQNFNTFYLDHIKQKNLINIYDADKPTSFIDVRDIAEVAAKFLLENKTSCKTITLTGSAGFTHSEVAQILSKIANKSIRYTAKSDDDTRKALRDCGWSEEGIERYLVLLQGIQRSEYAPVYTDVADILGRSPISFQQYAEDHKDFWN